MVPTFDADVLVIGSGFGGAVAALRFAEAGYRVLVLERGADVSWKAFRPDLDMFWDPPRQRFGMNLLRRRGRHVLTWTGSAVGGGSQVYAATLKRLCEFDGFPGDPGSRYGTVSTTSQRKCSERRSTRTTRHIVTCRPQSCCYKLMPASPRNAPIWSRRREESALESHFAPPGGHPGETFTNRFGVTQRYADPRDQSILGGGHRLQELTRPQLPRRSGTIRHEDRVDVRSGSPPPLPDGGWEVEASRLLREDGWWPMSPTVGAGDHRRPWPPPNVSPAGSSSWPLVPSARPSSSSGTENFTARSPA